MDFNVEDSDHETEQQVIQQLDEILECDGPSTSATTSRFPSSTVIESSSCKELNQEAKINKAISINKAYDEKLRELETVLNRRLHECDQKLNEYNKSNKNKKCVDKQESFRYVNCGKPYFRDRAGFTPPNNVDTNTMIRLGMYDFSRVSPVTGWSVKDKSQFLDMLLKMSKELRKNEIERKISDLKREAKIIPSEKIEKNIATLEKEMENLKKKSLKDLALPINEEYDWEFIATELNHRHSANEYQALWKLYLHPSINKNNWIESEHIALQKIAKKNKFQKWDDIAQKLGTERTGYQCFVYYRTNISNTITGQKWTKEEEEYLKRLIAYYREDKYIPWGSVAAAMENRTKIQIYNKYSRLVEQRKGRFLPEEDAVILSCADHFGPNFRKMASYIPGRSTSQLRVRYQILAKKRISMVWTTEEDKKLLKLIKNEDALNVFSALTKHFPGKNRMHIRSRYLTLNKWITQNPNTDISKAPRRKARRLSHGQFLENLNKAINNLEKRLESEVEERKCKKVTMKSPESIIDQAIMEILSNQMISEEDKSQQLEMEQCVSKDDTTILNKPLNVKTVKSLLIHFKAKLIKEQFFQSEDCKICPGLLKNEKKISLKTYSRKNPVATVVGTSHDIFGKNPLEKKEYVLPPNYDTITGCRQIMASIPKKSGGSKEFNIKALLKKNPLLREHFNALKERFCKMFLWPILLSKESPPIEEVEEEEEYNNSNKPLPKTNDPPLGIGIAIPELKSDIVNDTIDLEESENDMGKINVKINNFEFFDTP